MMTTPGSTGWPGKWPANSGSAGSTSSSAVTSTPGSHATTRLTQQKRVAMRQHRLDGVPARKDIRYPRFGSSFQSARALRASCARRAHSKLAGWNRAPPSALSHQRRENERAGWRRQSKRGSARVADSPAKLYRYASRDCRATGGTARLARPAGGATPSTAIAPRRRCGRRSPASSTAPPSAGSPSSPP